MHELASVSMVTLAQGRSGAPTGDVLLWVGVLIVLVMAATIVIVYMRKRLLGAESEPDAGSFLDELRAARNRGEITPEEFDAARLKMIEKLRGSGPSPADALRSKRKPTAGAGESEAGN